MEITVDKQLEMLYSYIGCENNYYRKAGYPPHLGTSKWPGFINVGYYHAAACKTDAVNERIVYYRLFCFAKGFSTMSMEVYGY